jgi:DNA-binding MarR family transcriptional regulator
MALLRISQAIKKLSLAEAEAAGLTPVQAQALLFVRHTKPFLTTIGRLAGALGVSHVTAVRVAEGLVQRGLLTKTSDLHDRRVTLLRLTDAGHSACAGLERFGQLLDDALGRLDPVQLTRLEVELGAVVWALREAGALQVAEPCRGCLHFRELAHPGTAEPHYCALIQRYLSETETLLDCPDHTPLTAAEAAG